MKSRSLLYHLFFWTAIYIVWVVIFWGYSISFTKTATIEFCYLIFITADYYVISNLIIPGYLLKKNYAAFALITLILIAASAFVRALVAVQMNLHFFRVKQIINFGALYIDSVINILFWVSVIIAGKMMLDRKQTQQRLDQLEKERIKNELDYLKAQINPHALFNSLNTIYGYIDINNKIARNTLLQFSELLRYQLYDCSAEKVGLEREIDYIKDYIAFQCLRKDERLGVAVEIGHIEKGLQIVPLLLVVIIENAFKFVSNFNDRENSITIGIYTKTGMLYSSIMNTTEDVPYTALSQDSNGIGILNLKRRLDLLYSGKYEFTTTTGTNFYETTLNINLT